MLFGPFGQPESLILIYSLIVSNILILKLNQMALKRFRNTKMKFIEELLEGENGDKGSFALFVREQNA